MTRVDVIPDARSARDREDRATQFCVSLGMPAQASSTLGACDQLATPGPPLRGDESYERRTPMPRFLKRGMDASAIKAADAKVRETVEGILGAGRGRARTPRSASCRRNSTTGRRHRSG